MSYNEQCAGEGGLSPSWHSISAMTHATIKVSFFPLPSFRLAAEKTYTYFYYFFSAYYFVSIIICIFKTSLYQYINITTVLLEVEHTK